MSAETLSDTNATQSLWATALASRGWFWAAVILAGGWLVALAILALLTANPVTLNRTQLLSSNLIVVATVTGRSATGGVELRIDQVIADQRFARAKIPATILLERAPAGMEISQRYLLPLRRIARGYQITPAPLAAAETWIVYPATDEVVARAKALLQRARSRDAAR